MTPFTLQPVDVSQQLLASELCRMVVRLPLWVDAMWKKRPSDYYEKEVSPFTRVTGVVLVVLMLAMIIIAFLDPLSPAGKEIIGFFENLPQR
jgi:hypothetical protein